MTTIEENSDDWLNLASNVFGYLGTALGRRYKIAGRLNGSPHYLRS
jgi:hypothetical protein